MNNRWKENINLTKTQNVFDWKNIVGQKTKYIWLKEKSFDKKATTTNAKVALAQDEKVLSRNVNRQMIKWKGKETDRWLNEQTENE